jgi:hypothetical protein
MLLISFPHIWEVQQSNILTGINADRKINAEELAPIELATTVRIMRKGFVPDLPNGGHGNNVKRDRS